MNDLLSGDLFATDPAVAARSAAIDILHEATNHYTARHVVEQLMDHVGWPQTGGRMADASCGDGSVLTVALERLLRQADLSDEEVAYRVQGFEVHPYAAAEARARVSALLVGFGRDHRRAMALAERIVHNTDFLTEGPTTQAFDLHLGNPPFLRYPNVPEPLRSEYVQVAPSWARADLLHTFLDRCASTLRSGGVMGLVLSDRVLFNQNAAELRARLGRTLAIRHLQRLDQSTSFYRPKLRKRGTPPRIHPVLLVLAATGRQLSSAPVYPDETRGAYDHLPKLASLATIRLGPYLKKGVFLLTNEQAAAAGIPDDCKVRAVLPHNLRGGVLGTLTHVAIRTWPDEIPPEPVRRHLDKTLPTIPPRGRGKGYCPREAFHTWNLGAPSLVVRRIARDPRAVRLPPGILAVNHDLNVLSADPAMLAQIERALAGELAHRWMREHAPCVDNGFHTLNPTILSEMPIERRALPR